MMLVGIAPALPRDDSHALGDSCNPWPPTETDLRLAVKYKRKVSRAPPQASVESSMVEPSNTWPAGIDYQDPPGQSSSSSNRGSSPPPPSCLPIGGAPTSGISGACSSTSLRLAAAPRAGDGVLPRSWRPAQARLRQISLPPCSGSSSSAATVRTLKY